RLPFFDQRATRSLTTRSSIDRSVRCPAKDDAGREIIRDGRPIALYRRLERPVLASALGAPAQRVCFDRFSRRQRGASFSQEVSSILFKAQQNNSGRTSPPNRRARHR